MQMCIGFQHVIFTVTNMRGLFSYRALSVSRTKCIRNTTIYIGMVGTLFEQENYDISVNVGSETILYSI